MSDKSEDQRAADGARYMRDPNPHAPSTLDEAHARSSAFFEAADMADVIGDEHDAKAVLWGDDSAVMLQRQGERTARRIAAILRALAERTS